MDVDDLDMAISKVIERGYVEETGFREAAADQDVRMRALALREAYSARWRILHESFDDDEDELVQGLDAGFRESVQTIAPANLNETVQILRELRRDAVADALIEYYIEHRSDELKLFDLQNYAFEGDITDATLKKRFAERYMQGTTKLSLSDAVRGMMEREGGYTMEQVTSLRDASQDEVYQLFKEYRGTKRDVVKLFLQFRHQKDNADISQKAIEVLTRIGGESRLNAIRVRRYGVKIEDGIVLPPKAD